MKKTVLASLSCVAAVSMSYVLLNPVVPADAAETTVGICEAKSNTVRVYKRDGQLNLRAFDRINNRTWMNTAATSSTNPEVVQYRNERGEVTVTVSFNRNSPSDCSIQIGNKLERGTAKS
jgi:hypothetical protein